MDFHAAMETFAEAWVAANTQTAVNSEPVQTQKQKMPSKSSSATPVMEQQSKIHTTEKGNSRKETKSPIIAEGAKSLPIHCVVEQVTGVPSFDTSISCNNINVELDSYAILPTSTTLCDLVRVALTKLGYSTSDTLNAAGAIQLKNWKPLTFENISDTLQSTVEEMLGDLTNVATLKIRISSKHRLSSTDDVKEKLLQLLLNQSQGMLQSTGCPIDKVMLSSISHGHLPSDITAETRRNFDVWFSEQLKKSTQQLEGMATSIIEKPSLPSPSASASSAPKSPLPTSTTPSSLISSTSPSSSSQNISSCSQLSSASLSSHAKHTRMRTSFDPEHEIPRLQKWFHVNQHPTREQMIHFLSELNTLDSRKGRKQLDLTNIIYWFKNARAAFRRANKSGDDSQGDADDSLCLSFQEGEESTKDEGSRGLEEHDRSPVEESIPYLPNRNAVYVIPNPLHRVLPEEQATDLSTNKNREKVPSPEPSCHSDSDPDDTTTTTTTPQRPHSVKESNNDSFKIQSSRKRKRSREKSFSEDEENEPTEQRPDKLPVKQELEEDNEYLNEPDSSHLHRELSVLAHQSPHNRLALSIPHMPHPLAMHYIPLNAQYYHAHLQQRSHLAQQQLNVSLSNSSPGTPNASSQAATKAALDKKRRTRVFIDPLTEIPKLEQWFLEDTHPSAYMIDKYCEELNRSEYRRKYPRLEPKNVQLWFKNHRAKVKRMNVEGSAVSIGYKYEDGSPAGSDIYDYDQHKSQNSLNYEIDQGRPIMSA